MSLKKYIEVKIDVEGLHQWSNCDLPNVEYLKYLHRHTFQIKCRIQVTHGDRDVEFIDFKHKLNKYIRDNWYDDTYNCCNFKGMSCEHIAENLLCHFNLCHCSVSEDGEFFGIIEI
jgi:hypothetical protein